MIFEHFIALTNQILNGTQMQNQNDHEKGYPSMCKHILLQIYETICKHIKCHMY